MQEAMSGLTVFGADWCNPCKTVKKLLDAEGVPYTYLDVDSPAAKALAKAGDVRGLPYAVHNGIVAFTSVGGCKHWLHKQGSKKVEAPKPFNPFGDAPPGIADLLRAAAEGVNPEPVLVNRGAFDDLEQMEMEIPR